MRNLLYVLFIQGKWGLKKWQVSNISVLELYERPHQNFFVFEPEWCLFAKAAKKQIFSVSSTSAFYCTCISYNRSTFFQLFHSVQWLLKKMCLDFFILHSETFRIATFWNAFAHSRIVQKGQPMNGCNIAMEFIFSVLRNLEDKALHSTTYLLLFKYRLIKKIKSSLKVRMTL